MVKRGGDTNQLRRGKKKRLKGDGSSKRNTFRRASTIEIRKRHSGDYSETGGRDNKPIGSSRGKGGGWATSLFAISHQLGGLKDIDGGNNLQRKKEGRIKRGTQWEIRVDLLAGGGGGGAKERILRVLHTTGNVTVPGKEQDQGSHKGGVGRLPQGWEKKR